MLFPVKIHRFFFLLGLALSICALPYSTYALSVGLFTITINWLLEGFWIDKYHRFINRKAIWAFLLVYAALIVGFFYSENTKYAWEELRLWLPLLLIPIVVATSAPLKRNEFRSLLLLFCSAVFVASLISFSIYLKEFSHGSQNVRAISPYVSHIRLSLMVNLAIFILLYFAFQVSSFKKFYFKSILIIVAIWLIVFLFVLQSFTGIAIFGIVSLTIAIKLISSVNEPILKFSFIVGLVLAILLGLSFLAHTIDTYFTRNKVDFKNLPDTTINGNRYTHDTISRQYENGNLVCVNICYPELAKEWSKVSKLPFDGTDNAGQRISLTLIRYMASKGLSKDSVGMASLDSFDVKLIENSVASVIYREHKTGIYPRLYQMLWELDSYFTRGAIGGSSLVQRYIYLKASWQIIQKNLLFGVGIGDGPDTLKEYYRNSGVNLDSKYWFLSHNQYLTVWIVSGLVGLILFLVGLLYPFFHEKRYKVFLCVVFQIIILVSMLNEDTFETHIGVSFAALFYAILFFGYDFLQDKHE